MKLKGKSNLDLTIKRSICDCFSNLEWRDIMEWRVFREGKIYEKR